MKKFYLLPFMLLALMASCAGNGDDPVKEPEQPERPDVSSVNFRATIAPNSRATETAFEEGDAISVFAVDPKVGMELKASGNYADNVKYTYTGGRFEAGSGAISISESNKEGLGYYGIYPYSSTVSNKFKFTVKPDQSTHVNYTSSDLCTAFVPQTTDKTVTLGFYHRLSNIVIKFYGDNLVSKNIKVRLENVYTSCNADVNANTYNATGNRGTVVMGEESGNAFQAIIVPQTVAADQTFMVVTMSGVEHKLSLNSKREFKSGKQTIFEYEINDEEIVELNAYIHPWDTEDERLESVVPEEILEKIDDHMPIYSGVNPPNVEGAYLIEPFVAVYCEDNYFSPGDQVNSEIIRFTNQNDNYNTLDFEEITAGGSHSVGEGAFISGSGNNFTAFFNTIGEWGDGVTTYKTALVISGTKASTGIKNLYYSFVMVEAYDPYNQVMEEGVFRVFKDKDGLSENTTWSNTRALSTSDEVKWSVYSFVK